VAAGQDSGAGRAFRTRATGSCQSQGVFDQTLIGKDDDQTWRQARSRDCRRAQRGCSKIKNYTRGRNSRRKREGLEETVTGTSGRGGGHKDSRSVFFPLDPGIRDFSPNKPRKDLVIDDQVVTDEW